MRILKIRGFIAPMDLNTGCCEDSMAVNLTNGRFAVADGVTNSVHPEIVSNLLCNYFVKGDVVLSDWPVIFENKLLSSISEEWKLKDEILFSRLEGFSKDLAEIKRQRKGPGASTFAGIEIDKVNNKVNYLILGDCTLFFIKEDGSYFAINSGQESHEKGDLLNFDNTPNCIVVGGLGQPQRIHGEWLTGSFNIESGYVLLMTDGCAEWFQGAYANDANVLDTLWNLTDNDAFAQLAEKERTINGKMDDDLAVIMLKVDTDIFQMEYFPTDQSQTMLIDKTGSVVIYDVDNNNANLEDEENGNNEETEIEVIADINESKMGNESEKDEVGETDKKVIVKENNIDESDNDESDYTESINHNDTEIIQEQEDDSNTLSKTSDSEIIETNGEEFLGDANEMTTKAGGSNNECSKTTPKFTETTPSAELSLKGILPSYWWDLIKCPYCGKSHKENTKFCPETGMPIVFCYYCGMIHKGVYCKNYCPKTGMPLDEEDVVSDSIHDNLEAAQNEINASDEDNHLPSSDLRDEQIVDVNVNIETVDSLTKNDSSVPVVQQSDTETLVEETSSKDEISQTPTEDFLEETDLEALESLPEASVTENPVEDNDEKP